MEMKNRSRCGSAPTPLPSGAGARNPDPNEHADATIATTSTSYEGRGHRASKGTTTFKHSSRHLRRIDRAALLGRPGRGGRLALFSRGGKIGDAVGASGAFSAQMGKGAASELDDRVLRGLEAGWASVQAAKGG